VISDGSYYFLSMIDDPTDYARHAEKYRIEAFKILGVDPLYGSSVGVIQV
jgi:hypothetical protein